MPELNQQDSDRLSGKEGQVLQYAMSLLLSVARVTQSKRLIDISQAHLVGAYYGGDGDLRLINKIVESGCKVAVATTLNASSVDVRQPWLYDRNRDEYRKSCQMVQLYQRLGCQLELTCAPYHRPAQLQCGDRIAWAESNAIVYANSVVGAYTDKTYQYLDLCAALTGRIPEFGLYLQENRKATILIQLVDIPEQWLPDDSFYQLLGIVVGRLCSSGVPAISGLPGFVSEDQLRGLGAASASSGNVKMFHAIGITPEAQTESQAFQGHAPSRVLTIGPGNIVTAKNDLSGEIDRPLSAVTLGAPHFSFSEFNHLNELLDGRRIANGVKVLIATSRYVQALISQSGLFDKLVESGIRVVTDTCTYYGSLLQGQRGLVMTSSAKWAYYAPGNLGIKVLFSRLEDCVESAIAGRVVINEHFWMY